jgi:hypothetical protein
VFIEQTPQVGGLRIAWAVERSGLDTGSGHGREGGVYACILSCVVPHGHSLSSPQLPP